MLIGTLLFVANIVVSARKRTPAGPNPWDAGTLEWATSSPPPRSKFSCVAADPVGTARVGFAPRWSVMTTARTLFFSSAAFAIAIATHIGCSRTIPPARRCSLFMAAGLLVVAFYMVFAERDADLCADKPDATMADARGEHVGTFIVHSPAPFWIGVALSGVLLGIVVAPAAAGLGAIALCVLAVLLVVRSR